MHLKHEKEHFLSSMLWKLDYEWTNNQNLKTTLLSHFVFKQDYTLTIES